MAGAELPPLVDVATRAEQLLSRRAQEMDAKHSRAISPDLDEFRLRAFERPGNRPCILLEGAEACVLWKPPGWTVSVGSFDEDEEEKAWRSGAVGQPLQSWVLDNMGPHWPIARDEKAEFGLVHRLDRDTSGPILCAKTYRGFHGLQLCLVRFQLCKDYVCLCEGFLSVGGGPRLLDAKLRVEGSGKSLRSVVAPKGRGQRAVLEILEASHFLTETSEAVSLVRIRLRTGRMHQIRAQLSSLGHPLLGDVLYGTPRAWLPRIFLHAASVGIRVHGLHGEPFHVDCVLPPDLQQVLGRCVPLDSSSRSCRESWLNGEIDGIESKVNSLHALEIDISPFSRVTLGLSCQSCKPHSRGGVSARSVQVRGLLLKGTATRHGAALAVRPLWGLGFGV